MWHNLYLMCKKVTYHACPRSLPQLSTVISLDLERKVKNQNSTLTLQQLRAYRFAEIQLVYRRLTYTLHISDFFSRFKILEHFFQRLAPHNSWFTVSGDRPHNSFFKGGNSRLHFQVMTRWYESLPIPLPSHFTVSSLIHKTVLKALPTQWSRSSICSYK